MTTARRIVNTDEEFARKGCSEIAEALTPPARARRQVSLVLAGGGTPRTIYERLASEEWRARIDWERVEVFFGDERCVRPDDPQSNYRMAKESLIDPLDLPAEHVHRIEAERGASEATRRYAETIRATLGRRPRFDCVLLGVGDDGHTASLFPGDDALAREDLVAAARSPRPPHERVTLTLPALNAARRVIFLVRGEEKAEIIARLLGGHADASALPAGRVRPVDGSMLWILDAAAASRLDG